MVPVGSILGSQGFDTLGAVRITDVYHSAEYFDLVMQALGWSEEARVRERRRWCKGEISAREWLEEHLPEPSLQSQGWLSWSKETLQALQYLEKRLDNMDYPAFKTKGYPIGSGQIEGMNPLLLARIGNRLKLACSGPEKERRAWLPSELNSVPGIPLLNSMS
jgi:hypothetical protein